MTSTEKELNLNFEEESEEEEDPSVAEENEEVREGVCVTTCTRTAHVCYLMPLNHR